MSKLLLKDDNGYVVKATPLKQRPGFKQGVFGRTWQWGSNMTINGKLCNWVFDNTWGTWWYFEYKGTWYKVHMWDARLGGYEPFYDMKFEEVDNA